MMERHGCSPAEPNRQRALLLSFLIVQFPSVLHICIDLARPLSSVFCDWFRFFACLTQTYTSSMALVRFVAFICFIICGGACLRV